MDYNILRENDIRGSYPEQINVDSTRTIGKAFAYYLKENGIRKCIVGHDNRLSGEEITEELIDTLLTSGIDVLDIGLVTTAMYNYASIYNKIEYGIMVTASHNKSSDNGFKIFGKNYLHLPQNELKKLYSYIKSNKETNGLGAKSEFQIKDKYIEMMLSKFPKMPGLRVVVDCGNGTASIVMKDILSKIFLDVTYLNCTSDGSFPVHNPDPNVEANLKWLKDMIRLKRANLGIAVDGDCDRIGIVDENGNTIFTDYLIAALAQDIVPKNNNKRVIIDVKCSSAVEYELKKMGAKPMMVKNGSAYIEGKMFEVPALIGGEYSGHVFFKDEYYGYDDGIYAGLRVARLMYETNKKASELTANMKKLLSTEEIRLEVKDEIKTSIVNKVIDYALSRNYNCNLEDGLRVNYQEGFALIRKSNTGPFITMRFESSNEKELNRIQKEFTDIVNRYLNI